MPLKEYRLPSSLRERLAKPIGKLFKDEETNGRAFRSGLEKATFVVTVGDRVTERIAELGRIPDVQVVDGRERRGGGRKGGGPLRKKSRGREHPGAVNKKGPRGGVSGGKGGGRGGGGGA